MVPPLHAAVMWSEDVLQNPISRHNDLSSYSEHTENNKLDYYEECFCFSAI